MARLSAALTRIQKFRIWRVLVADPQQVEEGRGHRKARKAYEHDRYHGVPDKGHVAPQRRHYVLAIDQGLTLPQELLQDIEVYLLGDHPAYNLYVKNA
jgi:hypothetical protein